MALKTEILISGAGVAGLCLALLLARLDVDVMVVDPATPPPPDPPPSGRTAAIMQHNLDVLTTAGLTEGQLTDMGQPMTAMRLIEPEGKGKAHDQIFRAREIGLPAFGLNLPLAPLHAALYQACQSDARITLRYETPVESLVDQVQAALLVAADGRKSPLRQMAGITVREKQYDEAALTCLLSHTLPHHDTSTEIHYRGGPFTLVPFQGNTSALVYVDKADVLQGIPAKDLLGHLQQKSRGILGDLTLLTPPDIWPLMSLRATCLTAPRLALVAEAAHVVSPIGAQGLNLSLRDVWALREAVARAVALGLDLADPTVLEDYERARAQDVLARSTGVDLFHATVASLSPLPHAARRAVAGLVDRIPALRRRITLGGLGV